MDKLVLFFSSFFFSVRLLSVQLYEKSSYDTCCFVLTNTTDVYLDPFCAITKVKVNYRICV